MAQTTWGTSARSSGEIRKGESFAARTFHVGHLVLWWAVLAVGVAYFFVHHFKNPLMWLIAAIAVVTTVALYVDFGSYFSKVSFRRRKTPAPAMSNESFATLFEEFSSDKEIDVLQKHWIKRKRISGATTPSVATLASSESFSHWSGSSTRRNSADILQVPQFNLPFIQRPAPTYQGRTRY
jgi:hypothetical protein